MYCKCTNVLVHSYCIGIIPAIEFYTDNNTYNKQLLPVIQSPEVTILLIYKKRQKYIQYVAVLPLVIT